MGSLTESILSNLETPEKNKKFFDGKGLYLFMSHSGGKWWRFKYRLGGKENLLSLGTYPEISLDEARSRRDACRKSVAHNKKPKKFPEDERMNSHNARLIFVDLLESLYNAQKHQSELSDKVDRIIHDVERYLEDLDHEPKS